MEEKVSLGDGTREQIRDCESTVSYLKPLKPEEVWEFRLFWPFKNNTEYSIYF